MPPETDQASLPGIPTAQPTDRLFFAVMPAAVTAERIAALALDLRERLTLSGRLRPTTHLHVTLHYLGDFAGVPRQLVETACAAAAGVAMAPFEARFDHVASFAGRPGKHPFVLLENTANGLAQLHAQLGARLAEAGLLRRERAFVPHLTLLYDALTVERQPVEPLAWPVREFVLIHSLLGRTEYRVLGRWLLDADSARPTRN